MIKGIVYCDKCGYQEHTDDVAKFAHSNCPKCGTPFMTDFDRELLKGVELAQSLGLVTQEKETGITLKVDSGKLKQTLKADVH